MTGQYKKYLKTYRCWQDMKQRCYNTNAQQYKNYGQRGIVVCDRWLAGFEFFFEDMGERPEGMSLDRINTNGNYEPSNCRWATLLEQNNNKRTCRILTHNGKSMTVSAWARLLGVHRSSIEERLHSGWKVADAVTLAPLPGIPLAARKGT
jgi:hypothetical protein